MFCKNSNCFSHGEHQIKKKENTLGAIEMIKFFPLMCLYHEVHWYTDIIWQGPS